MLKTAETAPEVPPFAREALGTDFCSSGVATVPVVTPFSGQFAEEVSVSIWPCSIPLVTFFVWPLSSHSLKDWGCSLAVTRHQLLPGGSWGWSSWCPVDFKHTGNKAVVVDPIPSLQYPLAMVPGFQAYQGFLSLHPKMLLP